MTVPHFAHIYYLNVNIYLDLIQKVRFFCEFVNFYVHLLHLPSTNIHTGTAVLHVTSLIIIIASCKQKNPNELIVKRKGKGNLLNFSLWLINHLINFWISFLKTVSTSVFKYSYIFEWPNFISQNAHLVHVHTYYNVHVTYSTLESLIFISSYIWWLALHLTPVSVNVPSNSWTNFSFRTLQDW